jgi:RNA polymerase-binding transcription factor
MNPEEKQEIRKVISGKICELEKSVEIFKKLSRPVSPDNAIGRITRMEAISSKSINEASLAKSKKTLKTLNQNLEMIDDPDFGFCGHCQEPIPFKRLLIMPEAPFCVLCTDKLNKSIK